MISFVVIGHRHHDNKATYALHWTIYASRVSVLSSNG